MKNTLGCLLLDASCLINIYATGCLPEIAGTLPYQLGVAAYVLEREALYTWLSDQASTREEREPIDLSRLVDEGMIDVVHLEHPEERITFVDLAALVDDGEAVTGALALHRGCSVATDDRKARRVLGGQVPSVPLVSTLELLKLWAEEAAVPDTELRAAMIMMRSRASYLPGDRDPLYPWWSKVMCGATL
ncbi:MAG: hypothetical protein OXG46_00130 [Chloroflexi bacterium]|nr:hypothetical protein [Chloroflexota bacterium]MCY3937316.1 hypothetical protein [Chloroflexota bacterium]